MEIKKIWKGYRIGEDKAKCNVIVITEDQIICIGKKNTTRTYKPNLKEITIKL